MKSFFFINLLIVFILPSFGQVLDIPVRPVDALSGTEIYNLIVSMEIEEREDTIYSQIAIGNIPDFMRILCEITVSESGHTAIYYVIPDYMALGSDSDYFLMPMTPILAQRVADLLKCNLPTTKMVDDIHFQADVKLSPAPIPWGATMTTVPIFWEHNTMVKEQREDYMQSYPLGALVDGDKKDVVITPKLYDPDFIEKVAIYGWYYPNGTRIQSLYTGHYDFYADYSHGIRLVQLAMTVDGIPKTVPEVLADSSLAYLLSNEGAFINSRYPVPTTLEFPYEDSFPAGGREQTNWIDKFTTPELTSFSPTSPDGDGYVLVVQDPSGGIDTTRIGIGTETDYFVQCYIYCNYRPELSSDGFERVGIFIRDNGKGLFEGTSGSGDSGNCYALTWDSGDGRVNCFRVISGVPTDLNSTPVYLPSTGWRKFRIEAYGNMLKFIIDNEIILSIIDSEISQGVCGIGYHEYFTTPSNMEGTHADNFIADVLNPTNSTWMLY